jgi:hypothetical protein
MFNPFGFAGILLGAKRSVLSKVRVRGGIEENRAMVKTLERAMAEVERLPADVQERIGRELLAHVEKFRHLRAEISKGIRSLDRGTGRELDIEDVIKRARRRNAKA